MSPPLVREVKAVAFVGAFPSFNIISKKINCKVDSREAFVNIEGPFTQLISILVQNG